MKEQYWKYSLIIFIIGLGILLFRQAQPFMNGILGGFTLYILLRNFSNWLQTKIKPLLAVWMITIGVTLFILIPVSLVQLGYCKSDFRNAFRYSGHYPAGSSGY